MTRITGLGLGFILFGKIFKPKKFSCQWADYVKAMAQIPKKDYFAVPTALPDRYIPLPGN
jgi:hypothetical protein